MSAVDAASVELTGSSIDIVTVAAIRKGHFAIAERGNISLDNAERTEISIAQFLAAAQAAHRSELNGEPGIEQLAQTVERARSKKHWAGVLVGCAMLCIALFVFITLAWSGPTETNEENFRLALIVSTPMAWFGWRIVVAKRMRLRQFRNEQALRAVQSDPNLMENHTTLIDYYFHRYSRGAAWLDSISTIDQLNPDMTPASRFIRPPLKIRELIPRSILRRREFSPHQPEQCLVELASAGFVITDPDSFGKHWLTRDASEMAKRFNHVRASVQVRSFHTGSAIEWVVFQPRWIPILLLYAAVAGAIWRREMMLAGVASFVFLAMVFLDCWRPVRRPTKLWLIPWGLAPLLGLIVSPNPDGTVMSPPDALDLTLLVVLLVLFLLTPLIFSLDRWRIEQSSAVLRLSHTVGLVSTVGCFLFQLPMVGHLSFAIGPLVGAGTMLLLLLPILESARIQQNALSYQIGATLATFPTPDITVPGPALPLSVRRVRQRLSLVLRDEAASLTRNSVLRVVINELSVMSISSLRHALPITHTYLVSVMRSPFRLPGLIREWPATRSNEVVQTLKTMLFALFVVGLFLRSRPDSDELFSIGNNAIDTFYFVFIVGLGIMRLSDPANLRRLNLIKTFLALGTLYAINLPVIAIVSIVWEEIEAESSGWAMVSALPLTLVWAAIMIVVMVRWLAEAHQLRWSRIAIALACAVSWLGPIDVMVNPISGWATVVVESILSVL